MPEMIAVRAILDGSNDNQGIKPCMDVGFVVNEVG
ncbi:hypothetical protein SAMN07250955_10242 [Arboricoccus pini]|uniref:Uncharacterized protein n=1 Tax=Arboricoccus pini TaxID=1963835 RepID=A0A212QMY8_9PROT|nr:hypothetical protein SAMN07250955_10242 [Arboricoccus pini]